MNEYFHYPDIDRSDQMPMRGRELLGERIFWTIKRDGQNVQFYVNPNSDFIVIGSRHHAGASEDIQRAIKKCDEWPNIQKLIRDYPHFRVFVEHIMPGYGPTRTEEPKEKSEIVLLDIYDSMNDKWWDWDELSYLANGYKIPMMELMEITIPETIEELRGTIEKLLGICKEIKREGVVGHCWTERHYFRFKEKVVLPKYKKERTKENDGPLLPEMPTEKIDRAIESAIHKCEELVIDTNNPKTAMPIVARYVTTEAREHSYEPPHNIYIEWCRWRKANEKPQAEV